MRSGASNRELYVHTKWPSAQIEAINAIETECLLPTRDYVFVVLQKNLYQCAVKPLLSTFKN